MILNIHISGEIKFEGQDIYGSKMDLVELRKECWNGVPAAKSFSIFCL
jgi:ABC-type phosphate transport system ATPase subunit